MRIKENLPWSIQSPVIHLVQPSPSIPLEHEIVFRHNGSSSNAIYALAAQDKEDGQKVVRRERQTMLNDKRDSNMSCGYISLPIHQASHDVRKKRNSFYDLRSDRSTSSSTDISNQAKTTSRSKSMDESYAVVRRKTSPDFEDILRDLGRVSSGESSTSTSDYAKSHKNLTREDSSSTVMSGDSVFYDVSLDDSSDVPKTPPTPLLDNGARKSFSEETFDKNRLHLIKERSRILQMVKRKERTSSVDSSEEGFEVWGHLNPRDRRRVSQMVDDLLMEIYGNQATATRVTRRRSCMGLVRGSAASHTPTDGEGALHEDVTSCTDYTSGSESSRRFALQRKGKWNGSYKNVQLVKY